MRDQNTVRAGWSRRVRDELLEHYTKSEKCRRAELMAVMLLAPQNVRYDGNTGIFLYEETQNSGKNHFTDRHKTYNIKGDLELTEDPKNLFKDRESKRAFLRGAFIATGSFTDPQKRYQFELITEHLWQAEELQNLLADFGIHARIMERRERFVVYLKDGPAIVDTLNVIGAHKALMEFENIRILKEMRSSVNRQVNCETANINKAVEASLKQLEDIELIDQMIGLDNLEENLRQICLVRKNNPDAALSELGNLMTPALGKSGVNHRFRKISRMAEELRQRQEKPDGTGPSE